MAGKLSFSIAINLLTENFKKGASKVQSMFAKMKGSVLGFAAVLGIGGASLRSFIETTAGFEAAVSKLSAILGTTPDQIKALTDNAKKLGETTKYTAAEATNLQTELAKLGFTKNEILSATESVLKFAQATDAGLAEAAALAGAAIRMFGAEASESKRYVSAMSIATTKSALSFAYLRDALPTVGPVAKAFNFEIEDTLALLGKLADSGFDASSAATATRNILLNLADSGGKLATALGGPVKTLPELVSGLQKLKDKGVDLNTTLQLTDKRSVAAFNAFLQSADKITPLRDAITGVDGDLDQMASTMGDNVKGAMAGLGSAWEALMIKMSENTSGPLKDMINWFTGLLRDLKSGFSGVVTFVITLISGKLLQSIAAFFAKGNAVLNASVTNYKLAEERKLAATQKRIEAEQAYLKTHLAYETRQNGKRLASAAQLKKSLTALEAAKLSEKRAFDAASVASTKAAAVQSMSAWQRSNAILLSGWKKLAIALKSLWSTLWPMALLTAFGAVIGKLVNMRQEARRIKNIFADYQKGLELSGNTQEVTRMQALLNIMNDRKSKQKEINSAQLELGKMVDGEKLTQEELIKKVKERIALLKEAAMAEAAFGTVGEYTERNAKLASDAGLSEKAMERLAKLYAGRTTSKENYHAYLRAQREEAEKSGNRKNLNWYKIEDKLPEVYANLEVIDNATQRAGKHLTNTVTTVVPPPPDDPDQTELQKQQERYAQSLRELNARKEVEKLTTDQYNKAYDELNRKSLIEAKSSDDKAVLNSKYIKLLQDKVDNPLYKEDKVQIELAKVEKEYQTSVSLAKTKLDKKLISEEEYRQAIIDAAIAATNSAISIEGVGDAADELIKRMQGVVGENMEKSFQMPKLRQRDTTFDYKKTDTDKLSEKVDIWIEYRDNLKEKLNGVKDKTSDLAKEIQEELNNAIRNTDDLETALKIAQVKQDVEDFSKELNEGLYSGVKNIASSSDRMVSSFENLRDVFDDVDSSGWERIMAIWNAMTNTIDGIMSIIKTIETLTELTNKLARAKEAEAAIDKVTSDEKVINAAKGAAATIAETQVEKSAATTEVAANTAKGASAAGASAAKLPFPWNIVAIGGAIAAAIAAFAVIPKFAGGGIVTGGPSSGDKILARVNAGEMILNGRQQSNLFEAINSGKIGSSQGQSVHIGFDKVRGSDIYLSLKNYMKSTGKKL
ncbi:phage tail tape measure protein [uncultured Bacteroides sp.]|uniref:phage tail tape measure protein n=1 Tax=uncultured Bacteroides sp. TaxID=162156 RepID=UPI00258897A8|nr:phage tail tape measure protein [uncultured Bacteroides sp.]